MFPSIVVDETNTPTVPDAIQKEPEEKEQTGFRPGKTDKLKTLTY